MHNRKLNKITGKVVTTKLIYKRIKAGKLFLDTSACKVASSQVISRENEIFCYQNKYLANKTIDFQVSYIRTMISNTLS